MLNQLRVLIVDDDEFIRELMETQLRQCGVQHIEFTADGTEAMRKLRNPASHPDYLICDVYMPEGDGFEVISALIEMKYQGRLVIMSGASLEMLEILREIALKGGLNLVGALIKPVDMKQLANILESDA